MTSHSWSFLYRKEVLFIERFMIVIPCILLLAILLSKFAYRLKIPSLLLFLCLGMIFGSDGLFKIAFDDYQMAEMICSIALLLIIFNGGFSTNWKKAKHVFKTSLLLSTVGTLLTALLTGLFCYYVFHLSFWEALLIGSVLSSTDAASVFSILKSNNLNFKHGIASLLEMESGSNDPMSYMLTVICIQMLTNQGASSIPLLFIQQFAIGIFMGVVFSYGMVNILKHIELQDEGLYPVLMLASVLLSFELCSFLNGNGYICVYLLGIVVGNTRFPNKRITLQFFDGIGWLMQILLFFALGLLSYPSRFLDHFILGALIALFITFVARPLTIGVLLTPLRFSFKQQLLISWVGFRGAASIAFSIMAVSQIPSLENDLFHIVFLVSVFTVLFQGMLLPTIAKKLDLVETQESVLKTFSDYEEGHLAQLYEIIIDEDHPWLNQKIKDAPIDKNMFLVGIKRRDKMIVPKGAVKLKLNDCIILTKEKGRSST